MVIHQSRICGICGFRAVKYLAIFCVFGNARQLCEACLRVAAGPVTVLRCHERTWRQDRRLRGNPELN